MGNGNWNISKNPQLIESHTQSKSAHGESGNEITEVMTQIITKCK